MWAKTGFIILMSSILNSAAYAAAGRDLGLGVFIGEPTGLSATIATAPNQEIRPLLAYSFDNYLFLSADYDFRYPSASWLPAGLKHLIPYVGVGGALFISSGATPGEKHGPFDGSGSVGLGLRVPLGIQYRLVQSPIEFSAEIVPGLSLAPSTSFLFQGGIGVTYFIK